MWITGPPETDPAPLGGENFRLSQLEDEVFSGTVGAVSVRVLREGRFIFDFRNEPSLADIQRAPEAPDFERHAALAVRQAEFLNSHVLCLHVALARSQRVALAKAVVSPIEFITYGEEEPTPSYGWIDMKLTPLLTASSLASYNQLSPNTFDWRLQGRPTVTLETITASFDLLNELLDHEGLELLPATDLYLRATAFFEAHDYNLALVAAWAIVETVLQRHWERYIDANRIRTIKGAEVAFINSARRTRLTQGRDYTASVIGETLSLLGELPHDLHIELDQVRRDRNRFLHELTPVTRRDADRALRVAERMLSLVEAVDLTVDRLSRLGG